MQKYVNAFLTKLTTILEFVIAIILSVGIIIMTVGEIFSFRQFSLDATLSMATYDTLVTTCFTLIIGVELIRMLYQHTPHTVFEVLLFAIARQIVIDHSSPLNSLIGVIAIAVLFATRKFLFVAFDESEKIIFRSNQKIRHINHLLHVHIPYKDDETIGEMMEAKLSEEKQEIGVGACAYFADFGLRIAKMTDGKITRIELIRSIH
ncbi:MAG: transporter [Hespellia sp.]|nr:transporter [Hespellia sp.]